MKEAIVIYGATALGVPEFSADLRWATGGYSVPDPVMYFEIEGKKILLASSLEVERAQKEAQVNEIVSLESYTQKSKADGVSISTLFLKERGVADVLIPDTMRYSLGKTLSENFKVQVKSPPFFPERAIKTVYEIKEIEKSQAAVEKAVHEAMNFLKSCQVKGDNLFHSEFGNTKMASSHIRKIIDDALYLLGYLGVESIVACGAEAADPHAKGIGLLRPHEPIVLDIFPRSLETLYFADQTRTVFKGAPSKKLERMYDVVLSAQERAISEVKPGADGATIEQHVREMFEENGFPTVTDKRPVKGFIHSLGHGVGIDIHEEPSLSRRGDILKEGNIVTVEPGLYYSQESETISVSGIRIEDMLLVTKDGHRNLTKFPKKLEDMVV